MYSHIFGHASFVAAQSATSNFFYSLFAIPISGHRLKIVFSSDAA